ncbi:7664_t:CDS:2, partial [Scutellospora calospora]
MKTLFADSAVPVTFARSEVFIAPDSVINNRNSELKLEKKLVTRKKTVLMKDEIDNLPGYYLGES